MRTNKLLAFAAVALLIINGVLVYFLWNEKKKPHGNGSRPGGNRGDWFAEQLKLDSTQKKEHKKSRDAHFESLKPLFDSTNSYKTNLYNLIKEGSVEDSIANSYSDKIAMLNKEIRTKTMNHLKEVRTMLNAEQKTKFDEMVIKMMSRKEGPPGKPGEKRKEEKK
jgi:Spy/CpxP family protein refolding chaperone